jgi:hypothetical protein
MSWFGMRLVSILFACLAALPLAAQDWSTRGGDARMDLAALSETVMGRTLVFFDDGQARFYEDGRYSYTYAQGGSAHGHYTVNGDSSICIAFVHGPERCDLYVRNGARLVLITEAGDRFPVRP